MDRCKLINLHGVDGLTSSQRLIDKDFKFGEIAVRNAETAKESEIYTIGQDMSLATFSTKDAIIEEINNGKILNIAYSELVNLRNQSLLIPGQQYRIIDYLTTTVQEDTISFGHQFDVIVTANSTNVLNENARAIQHENDTYFVDCNLEGWTIFYCLDNDNERFYWADATNGKGVIYRMIDEFGNDCPYDFKNIGFKDPFNSNDSNYYYTFTYMNNGNTDYTISGGKQFCYRNIIAPYISTNRFALNNIFFRNRFDGDTPQYCYNNTLGVNCGWNVFNGNCYHNILGGGSNRNYFQDNCTFNNIGDNCDHNQFGMDCSNNILYPNCSYNNLDHSCSNNTLYSNCEWIILLNDCTDNTFYEKCYYNQLLSNCNRNIFLTENKYHLIETGSDDNIFGKGSYQCTLYETCKNNILGTNNYMVVIGKNSDNNTIGSDNQNINIGQNSDNNTFGNGNQNISIGNDCANNKIGNLCSGVTIDLECSYNEIGDNVSGLTFGKKSKNNIIGSNCTGITFGEWCTDNKIGYDSSDITLGELAVYNIFGETSRHITLGISCNNNIFGYRCQNIDFGRDCELNKMGDYCNNIDLGEACLHNTFGNSCNNIGFGGNCTYNTLGSSCEYITGSTSVENVDTQPGFSKIYCQNIKMGSNCKYMVLHALQNQDYVYVGYCRNVTIYDNIGGTSNARMNIFYSNNGDYEIKIAKNSAGEIKIYCEADLIL